MPSNSLTATEQSFPKDRLQRLIDALRSRGYTVVGPRVDQDAIVYDELDSVEQLPRGWTDEQGPGHYRLKRRDDEALFGYVVGPHSWKKILFPPRETVLSAEKTDRGWQFIPRATDPRKFALLGVRACELAAIAVQDRVFMDGPHRNPLYAERRQNLFIIAVNCTQAASTCFCTSMNTGPRCRAGFDLALTEIETGFVCEIGSERGAEVLADCVPTAVDVEQSRAAETARQQAVDQIIRHMDTDGLREALLSRLTHPHWRDVGERCLSCTNCTMVCPTCFCSSVTEVRDLTHDRVDRDVVWDSCFNPDFSTMSSGPVRIDTAARYRQWLTHKLATWHDQFETSGCVGCGRCITWCPVGIDITAEVAALRESPAA